MEKPLLEVQCKPLWGHLLTAVCPDCKAVNLISEPGPTLCGCGSRWKATVWRYGDGSRCGSGSRRMGGSCARAEGLKATAGSRNSWACARDSVCRFHDHAFQCSRLIFMVRNGLVTKIFCKPELFHDVVGQ